MRLIRAADKSLEDRRTTTLIIHTVEFSCTMKYPSMAHSRERPNPAEDIVKSDFE